MTIPPAMPDRVYGSRAYPDRWYGGQFSLGHALFVGAGSYTIAVLLLHTGIPLFLTVLLSGMMAALIVFS